jgi:putative molybdopterin biosynthesis protein
MRFLNIKSIGEAKTEVEKHFNLKPVFEEIDVKSSLERILGEDIIAGTDVPPFDRARMDGYAVVAEDTFAADENTPAILKKVGTISAGEFKPLKVKPGFTVGIATGAPTPTGSDAVVMVEYTTELNDECVEVQRAVVPGENIDPAGSDISAGELILRKGTLIAPRHLGTLTAQGLKRVMVFKSPKVALLSTGNEVVAPGSPLRPGKIYDINSYTIEGGIIESGGKPSYLGIANDSRDKLESKLRYALKDHDIVVTTGGTSKGAGDHLAAVINDLGNPGVVVHGVSMKPGKPLIIGIIDSKLVFGLPGNPVSALMAYNVFVAGAVRQLSGKPDIAKPSVRARNAVRIHSSRGRHEFRLVHLLKDKKGVLKVYPVSKGSGAITALNEADGYMEIPEGKASVEKNDFVDVQMLDEKSQVADLTFIGSHSLGVELITKFLPFRVKLIFVGSTGGLSAVINNECHIAGIHMLHENGDYNLPYLTEELLLVKGFTREQGLMVKSGNPKNILGLDDLKRGDVTLVNRNQGSGTRILLDYELKRRGIKLESLSLITGDVKSHGSVAAAVAMGKADSGLGIRAAAVNYNLHFIPVKLEEYDFVVPRDIVEETEVQDFINRLKSQNFKKELEKLPGLKTSKETGIIVTRRSSK